MHFTKYHYVWLFLNPVFRSIKQIFQNSERSSNSVRRVATSEPLFNAFVKQNYQVLVCAKCNVFLDRFNVL